jgi:hypothetical protein
MECFTFIKLIFCGNKEIKISDSLPYQKSTELAYNTFTAYAHTALLRLNTAQNRNFRIFSGILPYTFSAQYEARKILVMI